MRLLAIALVLLPAAAVADAPAVRRPPSEESRRPAKPTAAEETVARARADLQTAADQIEREVEAAERAAEEAARAAENALDTADPER